MKLETNDGSVQGPNAARTAGASAPDLTSLFKHDPKVNNPSRTKRASADPCPPTLLEQIKDLKL